MKYRSPRVSRTSKLGPAGVALRRLSTRTKEGRLLSEQARATVEAAANLSLALDETGVSRIELARRLGVDRAGITRLLQGGNVSVERLAAAAHVLGLSVHVTFGPATDDTHVSKPVGIRVPMAAKHARKRK
jgi:transcriptional regulator with XRE-family HTH domain